MALGQDQQPRIVGHQGPASPALFGGPTDELVSIFDVEGGGTPGGCGQPSALIDEGITEMLSHQTHVMQVMVFEDGLIAPGDVLRRGQQPDVAMIQNVLFFGGKLSAFAFTHAESLKKFWKNVPSKVPTP
jgi:hypothetical protein